MIHGVFLGDNDRSHYVLKMRTKTGIFAPSCKSTGGKGWKFARDIMGHRSEPLTFNPLRAIPSFLVGGFTTPNLCWNI